MTSPSEFGKAGKAAVETASENGAGEAAGNLIQKVPGALQGDMPVPDSMPGWVKPVGKFLMKSGKAPDASDLKNEYPIGDTGAYLVRAAFKATERDTIPDETPLVVDLLAAISAPFRGGS